MFQKLIIELGNLNKVRTHTQFYFLSHTTSQDTRAEMSPVRVPRAAEPKNILRKYPNACKKVSHPVTMELSEREKNPSAVLKHKRKKRKMANEATILVGHYVL